ncbi:LOW QUALITY PROTEIN: hypothetical protein DH2020_010580 [Rehmannia glutinosa]|uniref:Protein kinase domain-containing protein n=1 Tax=Rehmannia glutinosa TaxID=99300 RepID=A0ABR0XB00_REHGL
MSYSNYLHNPYGSEEREGYGGWELSCHSHTIQFDNHWHGLPLVDVVSVSVAIVILLTVMVVFYYTKKSKQIPVVDVAPPPQTKRVTIFNDISVPLTYDSIVRATENFNRRNYIGSGGFGSTYKAEIAPGNIVAVKKLASAAKAKRARFHTSIILGRIKHPNLITLIGYYASQAERDVPDLQLSPSGNLDGSSRAKRDELIGAYSTRSSAYRLRGLLTRLVKSARVCTRRQIGNILLGR